MGGGSTRMGAPKALLDWHGTPLVAHVVGVLSEAVAPGPLVVVAQRGQELPALPEGVELVRDREAGRGPLQGLLGGLEALAAQVDAAFVAATDLPLLTPSFVRRLLDALEPGLDAAVPVAHGHRQPFAAAYRPSVAPLLEALLVGGERRAGVLLERCRTRFLDEAELLADAELARVDPRLDSLVNVNTPAEYAAALARSRRERTSATDP